MSSRTAPSSNRRWFAIGLAAAVVCGVSAAAQEHRGAAGDADRLQYVVVNGVRLAYRVEGRGVPVIFVHGESHTHELWGRQIGAIRDKYFFVSYDRRINDQR